MSDKSRTDNNSDFQSGTYFEYDFSNSLESSGFLLDDGATKEPKANFWRLAITVGLGVLSLFFIISSAILYGSYLVKRLSGDEPEPGRKIIIIEQPPSAPVASPPTQKVSQPIYHIYPKKSVYKDEIYQDADGVWRNRRVKVSED